MQSDLRPSKCVELQTLSSPSFLLQKSILIHYGERTVQRKGAMGEWNHLRNSFDKHIFGDYSVLDK